MAQMIYSAGSAVSLASAFLAVTAGTAVAQTLVEYQALPDSPELALPAEEQWTWKSTKTGKTVCRVANETPYGTPPGYVCEVVKTDGAPDLGYYCRELSGREAQAAAINGWKLTVWGRFWHLAPQLSRAVGFGVETSAGRSHVGFQTWRPGGAGTETTTIVGLYNDGAIRKTPNRAFDCFYHLFELVWDPTDATHTLYIDGSKAEALTGKPMDVGDGPARVVWGTFTDTDNPRGAHGYYNLVRFEIAPQAATPASAWELEGGSTYAAGPDSRPKPVQPKNTRPLHVGALCDFVDEASSYDYPITTSHLTSLMQQLKDSGVRTISWAHYADDKGGPLLPTSSKATKTFRHLKNPFAEAVKAAHAQGLEIFGYFKPYEMGVDVVFPEGSPEAREDGLFDRVGGKIAWADPFVAANPQYCIQHRSSALPKATRDVPIRSIKLRKSDDRPTRIGKESLEIWVSSNNFRYRKLAVDFDLTRSYEIAETDVHTLSRGKITAKGDRILVLTLGGLDLTDRYVLVTTTFTGGQSDFSNASTNILRMYDREGSEIVGCFANGRPIYNAAQADFRNWGLMFDTGYGLRTCFLDRANGSGRDGIIAFTRGRSPHLGAPCETEPEVQAYWLNRIERMLDDGADGIEFRIENHSTHTDFPEEYGFNQVVLDRLDDPERATTEEIAKVRGDAYTEFLVEAKRRIAARGKKMRINFELDFLRSDPPARRMLAYPANMQMQWERWIELGLPDEAVFRHYGLSFDRILSDGRTNEIAAACRRRNIPIHFNRYIRKQEAGRIIQDVDTIKSDTRFDGYVFYEVCAYMRYSRDGTCSFTIPTVRNAMRHAAGLAEPQ